MFLKISFNFMNDLYVFLFDTIAPLTEKDNFFCSKLALFGPVLFPPPLTPNFFPFPPPHSQCGLFPSRFFSGKNVAWKNNCVAFDHVRRTQFFASNIFLGGTIV